MSSFTEVSARVPKDYSFQYIVAIRAGRPTHMWTLSDERGAIHIHAWRSESTAFGREWMGGIEIHSPKPMYDFNADKPSHEHCWLLQGPCWHDGSSLYFSDYLAPMLAHLDPLDAMSGHVHGMMLGDLMRWHRDKFEVSEEEEASS